MDNTPLPSALHEPSAATPVRPEAVRPRVLPRKPRTAARTIDAPALEISTAEQFKEQGAQWSADWQAQGASVCVLQLSLQGLDLITERYGAEAGRQVGLQIAKRLRHLARAEDRLVQLSEHRFSLLVTCVPDNAAALARQMAARLVHELQRPAAYRTLSNLQLGCSIGSAIWHAGEGPLDQALAHAETALALARQSGRGQSRQYASEPAPVRAPLPVAQAA
jgi:GGDEF domain-containing protein